MIVHLESLPVPGKYWFFIVLAFFCLEMAANQPQNLPVNYYSVNHGLSYRMVTTITQDERGFVWIGTLNGLNRFDGYEFLIFDTDEEADYPLSESSIASLGHYRDGRLLVQYENNLVFFELLDPVSFETEKVNLFPQDGIQGIVRAIALDRAGDIYILSVSEDYTRLYRYGEDGCFEPVSSIPEKHHELSADVDLLPLQDGAFLINDAEKGLRRLEKDGRVSLPYALPTVSDDDLPYPGPAAILHQDRGGRILFALNRVPGLYQYDPGLDAFLPLPQAPRDKATTQLWEDYQGNLLLIQSADPSIRPAAERILCLRPNGELVDFNHLLELNTRIVSVFSRNFFHDIFLGLGSGLKTVRNNESRVATYLSQPLLPDQQGVVMRGIAEDGAGNLYLAREYYDWYKLDPRTNQIDTLLLYDQNTGDPIDVSCSMGLEFGPDGYLWGFTCQNSERGYLLRYDTLHCTTQVFEYPYRFAASTISRDGRIWLTTLNPATLVSFDPESGHFSSFTDMENTNPLTGAHPYYLIEDKNRQLWIGTDKGLIKIDPLRRLSQSYQNETGYDNIKSIYVLEESSEGELWIGGSDGLTILHPDGRTEHYSQESGLAGNVVCGLIEDENGNFWISTFYGLSYFDRQNHQFYNFFQIDGLSHNEFNRFSFHRARDGRYYFGGVNGLSAFYAEDLLVEENNPPVALRKIVRYNTRLDRTIVTHTNLLAPEELVIQPSDNFVEIHFMLPDYVMPDKNQFQIMLEGLDKKMNYLGNTPYVRFHSPPAGTYTLHILAADPNGNWTDSPLSIPLRIEQVFYKSWWFMALLVLASGLLVYGFALVRLRQKLRVEKLRTRLSSDLHDEVSGLLSSIAMQSDVLRMMTQDDRIQARLQNIGEVSRKAMTKMSDVIWSIDSRKDRVEDLLQRMREHADEVLLPINIRYQLEVGAIDHQRCIPVNIRQELFFIFKEAVNNIAKHSRADRVHVSFGNVNGHFQMVIKDNGQGANGTAPANRTGQGMSNLQMRAQRIKADLSITNREGYTVQVELPRFA